MGIMARSSMDPRWVTHHVRTVRGFMLAEIIIIRKNPGTRPTYDPLTQTWTGDFETIYVGNARVQPYGIIGDQNVAQDTTGRRLMRVQIEQKDTGVNLDDMLSITLCPNDPELEDFTLEVRGTIGSSNSWVTDLVCEANLKRNIKNV